MNRKTNIVIVIISLALGSYFPNLSLATDLESPTITFIGKVVYVPLEGGFYGLEERDTGKHYLPLQLPEAFQKAGIEVQVQAQLAKEMSGIHMWGEYVHIITIKEAVPPVANEEKEEPEKVKIDAETEE